MARVVDRVGSRVVIGSIDVVSRLEVTVVCIPSPRSVGVVKRPDPKIKAKPCINYRIRSLA